MYKVGFYPGNMQERLTRGTKETTGSVVRYEVICDSVLVGLSCRLSHRQTYQVNDSEQRLCLSVCVCRCLDVSVGGPASAHITDLSLISIINHCHQLNTLSISRLYQVLLTTLFIFLLFHVLLLILLLLLLLLDTVALK